MTNQNHTQFQVGQHVLVFDGTKMPPARFNRKLAAWKNNNYRGVIAEVCEPRDYSPYGGLVLKRDDYPDKSWITFQFHIDLGGKLQVELIAEAEAA